MSRFLILFALLLGIFTTTVLAACGYQSCPKLKPNMINIHVVPHTHDDVGWLKTVDQYYYGARNNIQHAGVQYIIDNVVTELLKNPNRRFIWVETAFLQKWYVEQTAEVKKNFKKLIDEGRLEITGGGWSMNDEAAAHYQSIIDQFTFGYKTLSDNFGKCARPRVAWQIDMFGHSREMASLVAQMGLDGVFFARMDWNEKNLRLTNKTGEMIWKGSATLAPARSELFTGMLNNHYSAPPGFCFDVLCSDQPIIEGESYDNNVKQRVDDFINYANSMAKRYRDRSNLMMPFGDDFNYENADMNFRNLDKLIKHVNLQQAKGSPYNLVYSTPSCYLNALHESKLTWPTKSLDFFPYATDPHTYWAGFYTSRPTQKRFEREGNHLLQVAKQLTAIANLTGPAVDNALNKHREAMGIMQHHDAITGTEKQHVSNDYDRILSASMVGVQNNTRAALQKLTNLTSGEFLSCLQLNISVCEMTQQSANRLVVTLFNPLGHYSTQYVRIPVKNGNYVVKDSFGHVVSSQIVAVPKEVLGLKYRPNITQHELVFSATCNKLCSFYVDTAPRMFEVEELPYHRISLPARFQHRRGEKLPIAPEVRADTIVENRLIRLVFNNDGILTKVRMNGIEENVNQQFYFYKSALGNNAEFNNRSSGAYIFRPNGTEVLINNRATLTVISGALVKEVHQKFNDYVSQVIRLYEGINRVEFEWLIGPIPIQDGVGKEYITRFTTGIKSNDKWETDSNGRERIPRTRNQREYFTANFNESVAGNYAPVTACISIQDNSRRLALLNDRSQGGTSLKSGVVDLMLHRRCLRDDAFGVGEALNETAYGEGVIARGKIWLMLGQNSRNQRLDERLAMKEMHLPFWPFFSNATRAVNKVLPKLPDLSSLPMSVELLTLEPYSDKEYLLRLENFLDATETDKVTFNLRQIFDNLYGSEIREVTLDGTLPLSEMKRFKFSPDGSNAPSKPEYYTTVHTPLAAKKSDARTKFDVIFDPMQIRTFIIKK